MSQLYKIIFVLILFSFSILALASESDGTIDAAHYYALMCGDDTCATTTKIAWRTEKGAAVRVTDSRLTGKIWSEKMGWINLNPLTSGVTNTASGTLGGYAWGENLGWINFAPTRGGVSITASGEFSGWAWAENGGWIKFDCAVANACVKTDWRPANVRVSGTTSGSVAKTDLPAVSPGEPLYPGRAENDDSSGAETGNISSSGSSSGNYEEAAGTENPKLRVQGEEEAIKGPQTEAISFFAVIWNYIKGVFVSLWSLFLSIFK